MLAGNALVYFLELLLYHPSEPFLAKSLECLKDVNCRLVSYDMRSNAEALDSHDFVSHC